MSRYLHGLCVGRDEAAAEFLQPTPETLALEERLDALGEDIRRFVYSIGFGSDNSAEIMKKAWGFHQEDIPKWQKWLLEAMLPLLKTFVSKAVDTSPESIRRAKADMERTLDQVIRVHNAT